MELENVLSLCLKSKAIALLLSENNELESLLSLFLEVKAITLLFE